MENTALKRRPEIAQNEKAIKAWGAQQNYNVSQSWD